MINLKLKKYKNLISKLADKTYESIKKIGKKSKGNHPDKKVILKKQM